MSVEHINTIKGLLFVYKQLQIIKFVHKKNGNVE